jgi:hypothetical protein
VEAEVPGLSTDRIVRGRKTAPRLKKGPICYIQKWVTIHHKSTLVVLEKRESFNF